MRRIEEEADAIRRSTQGEIAKHTDRIADLQVRTHSERTLTLS
jgi:hypothetical protein